MREWHKAAGFLAWLCILGMDLGHPSEAQEPKQAAPAVQSQVGVVSGAITVLKDGKPKSDHSGVVVYLEDVPGAIPAPQKNKEIRQKNLTFTPGLMVIVKGTTVEFPNDDKVFHNVFSVSRAAKFDLGLYKSGTKKAVTFKKPGVVDVYCNIHPQMVAKIKVLDTTYYAITGSDGSFRIGPVPPGTYPVVAWQAYGEEYRGQVTVTKAGSSSLAISLDEGSAPKKHLRKDGTPYGRYK